MPLSRRTGQRFQASIWPGFVDAMTGLLLVLMFVLTIFTVVQFVLRETITGQEDQLNTLTTEVLALAQALGLEQGRAIDLETKVGDLSGALNSAQAEASEAAALIAALQTERAVQDQALSAATAQIVTFEEQVAGLLAQRNTTQGTIADLQQQQVALEVERTELLSREEALQTALASSRSEMDAQTEVARLAAIKREALEALIADLRRDASAKESAQVAVAERAALAEQALSEQEAGRLAEAAAADMLRKRLQNADAELTAMTLVLEKQRQEAEDTLTLLAAAAEVKEDLELQIAAALLAKDAAQVEIGLLETALDGSRQDLQQADDDRALVAVQLEVTQDQLAMTQDQLQVVQKDLDGATDALNQTRAAVDTRAAQMSGIEQALAAALLELEAAQIVSVVNLQQIERERLDFLDRNTVLEQEITIQNDSIATQDDLLVALQQQLDQAALDLQQNVETANANREKMVSEISQLQIDLSALRSAVDAKDQALASLNLAGEQDRAARAENYADLEKAFQTLKSENDAQVQRVKTLTTEVEVARGKALVLIDDLETARAALQKAQTEARGQSVALIVLETESDHYKTALFQATKAIADLRRELAKSKATAAQVQNALEQDAEGLKKRLAAALAKKVAADADEQDVRATFAAALAAKLAAEREATAQMNEAETRAVLLSEANKTLSKEKAISAKARREMAVLNLQVANLRSELQNLQGLLDDSMAKDIAEDVQLQNLGSQLNSALARVAQEERKRRKLEEAERRRLEREALVLQDKANTATDKALDLERYRSEFFGRLRDLLGQQEGVRIVGDRFVFGSEVLFSSGNASLSNAGRAEVTKVAQTLKGVVGSIPAEINWVLRVDGHTDDAQVIANAQFEDNWELSTERALSVVRYLANELNIPPNRLAANGFGSYQPLNPDKTSAARAQNRRIELKLTEK
jgi:chemotaxis protein MotB